MTENLASTGLPSLFYADKSKREEFPENPNNKKIVKNFKQKLKLNKKFFL
jgi:hypothetical protein